MGAGQGSRAGAGHPEHVTGLARALADLARDMNGDRSSWAVLDRAVHCAVELVPHAEHGTITGARVRGGVVPAASTSAVGRRLDELQEEVGQGPCLDSASQRRTTRVDDLASETVRWPELAARSGEVGAASVLCLQLFVGDDDLGVLNLLAAAPRAFDEESERVGLLLAAHAAVALASAQKLENLVVGLTHRDVIGQAKGVLMERHRLSADQAFELLSARSQQTNRKLHDIAFELTATGEIPRR
ncbi:GAF and ANTAR domain-containing protein [Quadrisphaera setariae]|uniref:GAF and ANTAR domain-containing protein n=1 Tax=Quadrisphaera setariae TaxID=2593304 RepID=A0A5C8ZDD7_9ACTN|nr:GAF and ANTAR domain-containing protein [Quadrisphaera setariae]TXR56105.1 GAF and ANTAR domain-containing protein [Quadrisphaera setariae]